MEYKEYYGPTERSIHKSLQHNSHGGVQISQEFHHDRKLNSGSAKNPPMVNVQVIDQTTSPIQNIYDYDHYKNITEDHVNNDQSFSNVQQPFLHH